MSKGRTVIGLCMACALLVSAFAAQSASAETTAFTCTKTTEAQTWSDAHCSNEAGTKEYGHVTIPENTTTDITGAAGTSKGTQRLKALINGIQTELITTSISGTGSMHNAVVEGKMQATGTGTITYTNVTVALPSGKGCKVYTDTEKKEKGEEGVIHTNLLKAVTTEEMGLEFKPVSGAFATFIMAGCAGSEALEGLNKTYEVTGSVTGQPKEPGAETVFTHETVTGQNTLKLNGSIKAGIDGSLTISGKHHGPPAEENYKALSVTTPLVGGGYKEEKN